MMWDLGARNGVRAQQGPNSKQQPPEQSKNRNSKPEEISKPEQKQPSTSLFRISDLNQITIRIVMKRALLFTFALVVAVRLAAQGLIFSGFSPQHCDPKTPPPLAVTEAYSIVLARLGTTTNQFWCVSASCLDNKFGGVTHWNFEFSNTNGVRTNFLVFFDKAVYYWDGGSMREIR
jgi:hypothetical protein